MTMLLTLSIALFLAPELMIAFRLFSVGLYLNRQGGKRNPKQKISSLTIAVPVHLPDDAKYISVWTKNFENWFPDKAAKLTILCNGTSKERHGDQVTVRTNIIYLGQYGSKAKNLNFAIENNDSDAIAFFDADARLERPIRISEINNYLQEFDCVQGANIVRNCSDRLLDRVLNLESTISAAVSLTFSSKEGISQFRGTNGFWRAKTIDELRFSTDTALEDIDITIRCLCAGGRIGFISDIIAFEDPPRNFLSLLQQRWRWNIGWGHLCRRHTLSLLTATKLSLFQRSTIVAYLGWITFVLPLTTTLILIEGELLASLFAVIAIRIGLTYYLLASDRFNQVLSPKQALKHNNLWKRHSIRALSCIAILILDLLKYVAPIGFFLGSNSRWKATSKKMAGMNLS